MTTNCHICLKAEDWLSPDKYVVACGHYFDSKPSVYMIGSFSGKELSELLEEGEVIEFEGVMTREERERVATLYQDKYLFDFLKPKPLTHEQRMEITKKVVDNISPDYVTGIYLVGSTATNNDKPYSDLDMIVIRESCPGMSICRIPYEEKKDYGTGLELWCLTEEDLRELEKVNDPLVNSKRLLYSKKFI
jgi:predicted nucleotidyltransferase